MKIFKYDVVIVGGFGHIGLPLGIIFAHEGMKTCLYDINKKTYNIIKKGKMPFTEYGADALLKNTLKEYDLYQSDEINISQMRSLNRQLKKLGYKSNKAAIQLEHWKEVKKMRDELLNIHLKDDDDEIQKLQRNIGLHQTEILSNQKYINKLNQEI